MANLGPEVEDYPTQIAKTGIAAQVIVESDRGQMRFGSPFAFSLPAGSVITLTVAAPGYQARQEVMKPHYRRNVTLTLEIPLVPIPSKVD